jgi:hypothetical protein
MLVLDTSMEAAWQNALIYILYIWSLIWKGIALWRAAHYKQRNWFVVILVVNTIGLLEILYLLRFSKKKLTIEEMKGWRNNFVKRVPESDK